MKEINYVIKNLFKPFNLIVYIKFFINTFSKSFLIIVLPYILQNMLFYLNNETDLQNIIFYITKMFVVMLIVEIVYIQNNKRSFIIFNKTRRDLTQKINKKFMEMNYENFEDTNKLDEAYMAYDVTYSNSDGIEGIYHTLFELGWKVVVLIYFGIYFSRVHVVFSIIFILVCILSYIISKFTKSVELKNIEKLNSAKRKMIYFTYDSSDYSYGKEKRIYEFSKNIKSFYFKILNEFNNILNKQENDKKLLFILDELFFYFTYLLAFYILYLEYNNGFEIENLVPLMGILSYFIYLIKEFIANLSFCYGE